MTLIISSQDEAMFEKLAEQRFIKELYQFCDSSSPNWVKIMGNESISNTFDWFIDNIKTMELENRASYFLYLGTSLLLGGLFSEDIQYQGLMEDFNENIYRSESMRIEKLYQSVTNYEQNVIGTNKEFLLRAVEELGQLEVLRLNEEHFDLDMFMVLKRFYPEKTAYIQPQYYHNLIEWGKNRAQYDYALEHPNQWAIYIMLMFYLGQYFDDDPFLTWFDWTERLKEINQNQFNFKALSKQLIMVWDLKEKEKNNDVFYS